MPVYSSVITKVIKHGWQVENYVLYMYTLYLLVKPSGILEGHFLVEPIDFPSPQLTPNMDA
jgi:hypothetical protein